MSLFASAFDSGAPGPSRPLSFGGSPATKASGGGGAGKRKRPSLGDGKADQLRATQVNLEKLMSRVDRGEVKEKQGAEGLGQGAKKGKGGKGKQQQQPAKPQPKQQQQPKQKQQPKQQQQPKPDASPKAKKAKHDGGKQKPESDKPKPKGDKPKPKAAANPNRPAPVELPLPEVASAADDNLTDMQRAMKAKLEGARFRWINEQLYSTRSDDAVAMMAKDPKIFADVSGASSSPLLLQS